MCCQTHPLVLESLVVTCFLALTVFGFRTSLWVVVIALAAHGVLDLVHDKVMSNPGVPSWWRKFCFTYDIAAAVYLA